MGSKASDHILSKLFALLDKGGLQALKGSDTVEGRKREKARQTPGALHWLSDAATAPPLPLPHRIWPSKSRMGCSELIGALVDNEGYEH